MKVSVIIPTHKRGKLLDKTLKSVLSQTYRNLEIIVVSDGFDEETDKLMRSYNNDKIHYYVYEESLGANFARNYGANKSNCEYLAFIDDDDQWENSKIEKQMDKIMSDTMIGLVYTGNKQIYTDSGKSFTYIPTESGNLAKKIFLKNFIGSTSSVLLKREVFLQAGGFDNELSALQDYDLWIRVAQITKISVISEPLLLYFNDRSRIQISNNLDKYFLSSEKIIDKNKESFSGEPELLKKLNKFILETTLKKAIRNNNKKKAREIGKYLIRDYPCVSSFVYYSSTLFSFDFLLSVKSLKKRMVS